MRELATILISVDSAWRGAACYAAPAIRMQPFTLADGSVRYYARAQWNLPGKPNGRSSYALAGWMSAQRFAHLRLKTKRPQTAAH
jgi:hypothetical protein